MNRYIKYSLRGIAIIVILIFVLYCIALIYVSSHKQKIIKQVTQEISKKLNGNVTIGSVDLSFFSHFPQMAVELHNVLITDTLYQQHHHPFFQAQSVYARVSLINLISKHSFINGFRIDNGSFYLYTDTIGYTNRYLFNPKKSASANSVSSNKKNDLKSIVLNNVRIIEDNRKKNKLYDIVVSGLNIRLDDRDFTTIFYSAKTNLVVHSLAFNLDRGSFIKEKVLKGDFELQYDKKTKQLQFDSIDVEVGGHLFNMTGKFDLSGEAPQFSFRVHTKDMLYSFGKSLLTHKIDSALSIVSIEEPLTVSAYMNGPLKGGDPLVKVIWDAKNTAMSTPFINFEKASFKGYYINEVTPGLPRKDPNSKIVVTDFSASWNGLPFTSNSIEVLNLFKPQLTCDLNSTFALTTLNDIIESKVLRLTSGNGFASITYKGPLEKNNNYNSFINGVIGFKNGSILYRPRDVEMKNVNGRIVFKNSDVFVENLQCNVLNNSVVMQGQALNILTLMNSSPNNVNINWSIYSPSLNLNPFTFLLSPTKKIVADAGSNKKLVKFTTNIDQVLEDGKVNVNLETPRLLYKKFEAQNVGANILLLQDRYVINSVNMDHADGHISLQGSLILADNNYHNAKLNASLDNVDVSKIFTAFDNFGQDGITAQSLQGRLTAKIDASMAINNEGKADPASVVSTVDFSLKNGSLINYEPVKKLQNFLFKHRDFENIRFAELKDKLEIKNQEIKINRMEIQSTVMSMFVEGIYGTKGTTDISIQVPLSNIHKRSADYNPENIGVDKKGGSSVHIRGRPGSDGNIKFKLDLFNKYKKQKEKEEKNDGAKE